MVVNNYVLLSLSHTLAYSSVVVEGIHDLQAYKFY